VAAIAAMELHWDENRVEREISDTQNLLTLPV